jgi:hypothetical protein
MDAMDDKPKGNGMAWGVVGAALLIFPLLYVLSIGPAAWLSSRGYLSDAATEAIYYPIILAIERFEWCGDSVNWYIEFWLPHVYT